MDEDPEVDDMYDKLLAEGHNIRELIRMVRWNFSAKDLAVMLLLIPVGLVAGLSDQIVYRIRKASLRRAVAKKLKRTSK